MKWTCERDDDVDGDDVRVWMCMCLHSGVIFCLHLHQIVFGNEICNAYKMYYHSSTQFDDLTICTLYIIYNYIINNVMNFESNVLISLVTCQQLTISEHNFQCNQVESISAI